MNHRLCAFVHDLYADGVAHDATHADRLLKRRNLEPATAELLGLLVRIAGARRVVEIGTSNGLSTIWLAEALGDTGGQVTSIDTAPIAPASPAPTLWCRASPGASTCVRRTAVAISRRLPTTVSICPSWTRNGPSTATGSRYLRFRDALRANPALRDAYAELKHALAREFPRDREAYITGKTDFVERVLRGSAGNGRGHVRPRGRPLRSDGAILRHALAESAPDPSKKRWIAFVCLYGRLVPRTGETSTSRWTWARSARSIRGDDPAAAVIW